MRIHQHAICVQRFVIDVIFQMAHVVVVDDGKVVGCFEDLVEPAFVVEVGGVFNGGSCCHVVFKLSVDSFAVEEPAEFVGVDR